ncbi:hypothetical protein D9M70_528630 [compost metagenome]
MPLCIELIGGQQRLRHAHTAAYRQVDVEDRRAMALPGGLSAQAQLQRQARQAVAGDGLEVMQTSRQGADAVETGGTEHEAAQRVVIANDHVQSAVGLAGIAFGQRAGIRRRAGQRLHAVLGDTLAGLAVAHTERAAGLPIEQGVVSAKI